jgi:UDP-N-acetylmuramoyl-L-alanyl-D-glutamate--2,6-diaminopimelate ligase
MELDALIRAIAPNDVTGRRPVEIRDLAYDTRSVVPGCLYFCVPGQQVDGHDLGAEAVRLGADALVVESPLEVAVPQLVVESVRASMAVAADVFYGEPTRVLHVAGVTGTNGKSTTTLLLHSILEAAGRSCGVVGTIDWIVGGTRQPAPRTTPEAIDLQRLFRQMLDTGDQAAAIEASSHGSHFRRLDRVRFSGLVFTNLSQDHLDLHGTMEDYFQAKRRLFVGIDPPPAAVNIGDPHGRRLADELGGAHRAPLVTFGLRPDAEVRPDQLQLGAHGSSFSAAGIELTTPLRGIFNVENVLGAVAAALLLDVDEGAIVEGVAALAGVPGRFEAIDEGQTFPVIVDYAHTPDALSTVLGAARDITEGRGRRRS